MFSIEASGFDLALVRGALDLDPSPYGVRPRRLPQWALDQAADPQLELAEAQSSGVRVTFTTEATHIELDTMPVRRNYAGTPPRPLGVYDLLVNGELVAHTTADSSSDILINMATGEQTFTEGKPATLIFDELAAGEKKIDILLPHNEETHLVALRSNAPIHVTPQDHAVRWVHHGSSISHGSNATSPSGIWPSIAARSGDVELLNLGFGGSALMDPFQARHIRDLPADFISLKLGINLVNSDLMRLRAFRTAVHGYIDTIRDGHPETPIVLVSPIYCRIHESTPGPGAFDMEALQQGRVAFKATGDPAEVPAGRLTLETIREEMRTIVDIRSHTDNNLHFLDGLSLYGEADYAQYPLADELHPGPEAHALIGGRFAQAVFGANGIFPRI